jgi:transposase-like protein
MLQNDQQYNIKKFGKTPAGRQRYQCKTCQRTFTETKGTLFYRIRTPEDEVVAVLTLIAEGMRISASKATKKTPSCTGSVPRENTRKPWKKSC